MNIIKRLALGAGAALVALMPFASASAAAVRLESELTVANVNKNEAYSKQTSATDGEVVKIQVWYHNMENADSNLVASNLKVKINLPSTPGKVQTVTSTVSADNANTVTDTAKVNLPVDAAYLTYIPGSAKWRHNVGDNTNVNYQTTSISDDVVNNAAGVNLGDEKPCFNFESTVTILAKVNLAAITLVKQVRVLGQTAWTTENNAKLGDTLEYMFTFKNVGTTKLNDVIVGDNLPPNMTYIKGSTILKSTAFPNGKTITSDNIVSGGVNVGNYDPGSTAYVKFQAKINSDLKCDNYSFKNVGIVTATGLVPVYNTALTHVNMTCATVTPPPPVTPPVVTPPAPPALPTTGAEGALAGMFGTAGIGYSLRSYLRSKRNLLSSLRQK